MKADPLNWTVAVIDCDLMEVEGQGGSWVESGLSLALELVAPCGLP